MISGEYIVLAPEGLHARPAKAFLNLIKKAESTVTLKKDGMECDAKSMLGILSMQAKYNSSIKVEVDGTDEQELFDKIDRFFTEEIIKL